MTPLTRRGPCDRTCDALCDACTDPRAVSRALSRLESREAEVGNRAAQIRAKMLGINVPAPGDGEEEGGEGGGGCGIQWSSCFMESDAGGILGS